MERKGRNHEIMGKEHFWLRPPLRSTLPIFLFEREK